MWGDIQENPFKGLELGAERAEGIESNFGVTERSGLRAMNSGCLQNVPVYRWESRRPLEVCGAQNECAEELT